MYRIFIAIVFLSLPLCAAVNTNISIRDYGATGDGVTKETGAIQKAIDAAESAGGGTVYFPPGRYLSGTLRMKSRVTLYLEAGATLLGSTELDDFPSIAPAVRSYTDTYTCRSLLYGEGLTDIAIKGAGTIDGQGGAPVFSKILPYKIRPYIIRFITCKGIHVEGIMLQNSPMWMQHYLECDDVFIQGIRVFNHATYNNDVIDIDGCHDVCINNLQGDSDDDGLTLKSTTNRSVENVTITNCILRSHCNALKCGTESTGGFRNITISNCVIGPSYADKVFAGKRNGLAGIALESVDGGVLDHIAISNISITGTDSPIFLRLGNRARKINADSPQPGIGTVQNISITNVVAIDAGSFACPIVGLSDHPIRNVNLSDIRITYAGNGTAKYPLERVPELPGRYPECIMFGVPPAYGFYCRHVNGLTLHNVQVNTTEPDQRPAVICDDVTDLNIESFRGQTAPQTPAAVVLHNTRDALLRGCRVTPGVAAFLSLQGNSTGITLLDNDLSGAKTPYTASDSVPKDAVRTSGQ